MTSSVLDLRSAPPAGEPAADPQERVVAAFLRCVARWGLAKTTLDDVAREAGYSRATVYRLVPGGKDGLLALVGEAEQRRFFTSLDAALSTASTLEDTIVAGVVTAARHLRTHAALQFLVAHEPEQILPRFAFDHLDVILARVSAYCAPKLAPWLGDGPGATRAVEWLVRIVLSYVCMPSPQFDLTDEASARRLVRTFVLPGLTLNRTTPGGTTHDRHR